MKCHYAMGFLLVLLPFCSASRPVAMAGSLAVEHHLVILNHGPNTALSVSFDHRLHDSYAACSLCHHHLMGTPPAEAGCRKCHTHGIDGEEVACRSCHPVQPFTEARRQLLDRENPYHIDTVGLIGAYHLLCLDCHETVGAGPTGCTECHGANNDIAINAEHGEE